MRISPRVAWGHLIFPTAKNTGSQACGEPVVTVFFFLGRPDAILPGFRHIEYGLFLFAGSRHPEQNPHCIGNPSVLADHPAHILPGNSEFKADFVAESFFPDIYLALVVN